MIGARHRPEVEREVGPHCRDSDGLLPVGCQVVRGDQSPPPESGVLASSVSATEHPLGSVPPPGALSR